MRDGDQDIHNFGSPIRVARIAADFVFVELLLSNDGSSDTINFEIEGLIPIIDFE